MRNLIAATVAAISVVSAAHADQRCFVQANGLDFCYGDNGSHSTYVFRNGNMYEHDFNPPQMPQPRQCNDIAGVPGVDC
jgi:hypothetical protein